jgi:hypothetical protein
MPWQRTPREVYRVYGEDEYLSAEDRPTSEPHLSDGDSIGEDSSSALVSPISRSSHLGRLIGLGLLIAVTLGAISLVVVNMSRRSPSGLGLSRSAPARISGLPRGARIASSKATFDGQLAAKPSSGRRSLGHPLIPRAIHRFAGGGTQKSTPLRASIAPAPPLNGQVSVSQSEASPVDGEFDFER